MDLTTVSNTSDYTLRTESPSTTEAAERFNLYSYLSQNYIIIIIPSVFACIFLIIAFIILIKKILSRRRFDPKQLETYASVNYDDEIIDDELVSTDDLVYTSCKLLVGGDYAEDSELTNSEPEYDCMSVDVSVCANESSIVDWNSRGKPQEAAQELIPSSKTLPHDFWKR